MAISEAKIRIKGFAVRITIAKSAQIAGAVINTTMAIAELTGGGSRWR